MSIATLREEIKDFAKDTRINLGTVLNEEGAPGLTQSQIYGIALSLAYSLKNKKLTEALLEDAVGTLSDEHIVAAQSAASIMAMNNIYYRSLHLIENEELSKMPAKLRMNVIGRPGIEKVDFELYSLAVSALSGCGMCLKAHVNELQKAGMTNEGIQSSLRIAAVINAAAHAIN